MLSCFMSALTGDLARFQFVTNVNHTAINLTAAKSIFTHALGYIPVEDLLGPFYCFATCCWTIYLQFFQNFFFSIPNKLIC